MKKIKAIIRVEKYLDVRKALFEKGYEDIIVKKVKGRGLQWGVLGRYRAREKILDLVPKVKIELTVRDDEVDEIIKIICEHGRMGKPGDGKIFVLPMEKIVNI